MAMVTALPVALLCGLLAGAPHSAHAASLTASFESGWDGWETPTSNESLPFNRHSGRTGSAIVTGPTNASKGHYYVYAETSYPNAGAFEFSMWQNFEENIGSITFDYHRMGYGFGKLMLQASANGMNYTTLWSKPASTGDGNAWQTASTSVSLPYKWLRFQYEVGGGAVYNDLALDNIRVDLGLPSAAPTTSPAPSVTPQPSPTPTARPSPMLCTAAAQHTAVAATFEELSASCQGCGAQVNVSTHLTFTKPITISGRDLTIAGSTSTSTSGVAELTSDRNYTAERGGMFKVTDGSHVIFTRLIFINGTSALFGGCVYADGGSTVELRDTEFWRCSAPWGGGAYIAFSSAVLSGAVLRDCTAKQTTTRDLTGDRHLGGGLFLDTVVANMTDVLFLRCAATGTSNFGGGIFMGVTTAALYNATFDQCIANWGGGNMATTCVVSAIRCAFVRCEASYSGALYVGIPDGISGWGGSINMVDVLITQCHNSNGFGTVMIHSFGKATMKNVTISQCSSGALGGGGLCAFMYAHVIMDSSTIKSCYTQGDGGAISSLTGSTLMVTNTAIEDNVAHLSGGGIVSTASDLKMANVTLANNNASTGDGGGVSAEGEGEVVVLATLFDTNVAAAGLGGGLAVAEADNVVVRGSQISDCRSDSGGGISIVDVKNTTIQRTSFLRTVAATAGGALYSMTAGTIRVEDGSFDTCAVDHAVEARACITLEIHEPTIALGWGGAWLYIYAASDPARPVYNFTKDAGDYSAETHELCFSTAVNDNPYTFEATKADQYDGYAHFSLSTDKGSFRNPVTFTRSFVSAYDACEGPGGGAMFLDGGGDTSVHRCRFNGTTATNSAGGVVAIRSTDLVDAQSHLDMRDCTVRGGVADYAGAMAYNYESAMTVVNTFVDEPTMDVTATSGDPGDIFYGLSEGYSCASACAAGQYGDCTAMGLSGQCHSCVRDACSSCPPGKFGNKSGAISEEDGCTVASEGYYTGNTTTGATRQRQCPKGSYVTDTADDIDGIGVSSGGTFCVECPAGRVNAEAGQSSCVECQLAESETSNISIEQRWRLSSTPGATTCSLCITRFFRNDDTCVECPDHATCEEGTNVGNIHVHKGYYRFDRATKIYECHSRGCKASSNTDDQCKKEEGYEGPLCQSCQWSKKREDRYFYDALKRRCLSCAEPHLNAAQGVGIALIVLGLVGVGAFMADRSRVKRCIDLVDFGKLRVMFINAQILKSIPSSLDVVFPNPARAVFAALDLTALNPLTLIAGECVSGGLARYDTRVIVSTTTLGVVCAANWLAYAVRRAMAGSKTGTREMFAQHMTLFLQITFLFYPTLSLMQFEGFDCVEYKTGDGPIWLLRPDLSIDCDSRRYKTFFAVNVVFTCITQAVPVMYFYVLYRVRHLLHPASDRSHQAQLRARQRREAESPELKALGFLFHHYDLSACYFEVIESYRRIGFISILALIQDKFYSATFGVLMSIGSCYLFAMSNPYVTPSTNKLAAIASNQLMVSYLSGGLLLVRPKLSDSLLGGTILTLINVSIVPIVMMMGMRDHKAREEERESFRKLHKKLDVCTAQDRKKFEVAWAGYQNHAEETGNPDAEERLYAALANLALVVGSVSSVKQPSNLASSLDELMAAAETYNSRMHGVVRCIVEEMNGAYEEGPLKLKERVEEKAQKDYKGEFLKVVDIIRSSAVFHSFDDLSRAIVALNTPGVVQVVRLKDRITTPLPSGYRDVLLNITVDGCAMVMELQLHLKDVIAVKEQAHRIYDFMRTLGWEKDEIDEMEMAGLSDLEKERSARSNSSAKPPSLQARTTAGDGPVGLEMIRVSPMHDQLP